MAWSTVRSVVWYTGLDVPVFPVVYPTIYPGVTW
jgi:hypothetical protein